MKKIFCIAAALGFFIASTAYAGDNEKTGSKIKFRGLKSVDSFNVSYAKFSPFNNEDKERHGHGIGLKARIRPARIGKVDVGGYGKYAKGKGHTYKKSKDRWSHYKYNIIGGGLSGVYNYTENTEVSLDLGLLHQKTEYWIPDKFASHQKENQWEIGSEFLTEQRRADGELWFPQWSVNMHYLHPFDVSYSDTKGRSDEYAYDNRRISGGIAFDIYDWYVDDAGHWRITPTGNLNLGYIWGKSSGFLQGGLGTKLTWYDQEMIDINVLNPRWVFEGNGSRLYDFMGTAKPDNIIRAAWAAQTETYISKRERATMIAQASAE